jgi:hypothetical protein
MEVQLVQQAQALVTLGFILKVVKVLSSNWAFGKTDVRGFDSSGNPTNVPNGVSDELDDLRYPADGKKNID